MTTLSYLENSYVTEFNAEVIKSVRLTSGFGIVLDKTFFYPEGGGQPHDKGTLNEIDVKKVYREGEAVIHVLDQDIPLGPVSGKVEWKSRFDYMQQHSAQHVVSQAFFRIFSSHTIAWQLSEDTTSIEVAINEITYDDLVKVESLANQIIFENRSIKAYVITNQEELQKLPLRKEPLEKYFRDEGIRVVEIDQFDFIPCGGTHCARTGEIGFVVITSLDKRRNSSRIEILAGNRALENYQNKRNIVRHFEKTLGVGENQTTEMLEKREEDLHKTKLALKDAQMNLLGFEATDLISNAPRFDSKPIKIISRVYEGRDTLELRHLASKIAETRDIIVIFGNRGTKPSVIIGHSVDNEEIDLRPIIDSVSRVSSCKGGGTNHLVQIGGFSTDQLEIIINLVTQSLRSLL